MDCQDEELDKQQIIDKLSKSPNFITTFNNYLKLIILNRSMVMVIGLLLLMIFIM